MTLKVWWSNNMGMYKEGVNEDFARGLIGHFENGGSLEKLVLELLNEVDVRIEHTRQECVSRIAHCKADVLNNIYESAKKPYAEVVPMMSFETDNPFLEKVRESQNLQEFLNVEVPLNKAKYNPPARKLDQPEDIEFGIKMLEQDRRTCKQQLDRINSQIDDLLRKRRGLI